MSYTTSMPAGDAFHTYIPREPMYRYYPPERILPYKKIVPWKYTPEQYEWPDYATIPTQPCLIKQFFADPANRGKPCMIACPCPSCVPYCM